MLHGLIVVVIRNYSSEVKLSRLCVVFTSATLNKRTQAGGNLCATCQKLKSQQVLTLFTL